MRGLGLGEWEQILGADHPFDRDSIREDEVMRRSVLQAALVGAMLWATLLPAADLSSYRGFKFGASVADSAKQARTEASEVRILHRRPAVIEELDWRPSSAWQADGTKADPVWEGTLRFYNGQLFQIITTYDREKVQGMSEADMVEAISLTYGAATKQADEVAYHSNYGETARVIARWENPEYAYNLVRTGDQSSFALILNSKHLETLARTSMVEAARLDVLEAPQRALDLKKKQDTDGQLVLNKARSVNVPNFRP
jgi:hypothetical protein